METTVIFASYVVSLDEVLSATANGGVDISKYFEVSGGNRHASIAC